jgi:Mg-chelatase subunit ChlD
MTIQHMAGAAASQRRSFAFTALFVLLVLGNACSKKTEDAVCIDDDDRCGLACNYTHPCPNGLYCGGAELCSKACTSSAECTGRRHCNEHGECVEGVSSSQPVTAGKSGSGGMAANHTSAGQGSFVIDAGAGAGVSTKRDAAISETCQRENVSAARVIPNIVLVIDQSGSMTEGFGGAGTRWDVLRDFLLRPDGLIAMFETQVRFGLAMYTALEFGENGAQPPPCPMVTTVEPKLMNHADISRAYNMAAPLGETPTGDSIDHVVDGLPQAQLDQTDGPTVLILATDGEPDRCEQLNPQQGQAEAVAAVTRAFSMGIRTYIISVGEDVSQQHQQDVANAGIGRDASNNAPFWRAGDDASLRQALTEIIGSQVSCDVALSGRVESGDPCSGTVSLNSVALECNDENGWELADSNHIRLRGRACDDWKTLRNAQISAQFPCDVQIVF